MSARTPLAIVGALMIALGLIWIGQGLGLVRWPASSFMIDQRRWVGFGAALALLGLALALFAAGRRR
ncbi:MAG TPA: hypothetical protein VFK69_09490 [Candidatus Eisenbacteria bacterium]|nr:hypothetical protein [Candidatus Eisenbacteria bacterium]